MIRLLLCLLIVVGFAGCGRRPGDQAPPSVLATPQAAAPANAQQPASPYPLPTPEPVAPYPLGTAVPPLQPADLPAPYPPPTIPPVPGQDSSLLALNPVNLQVSPDGRYVVFNGDPDGDRVYSLFSLALEGARRCNCMPPQPNLRACSHSRSRRTAAR
ncbi:MAG: hypothetical protein HC822_27205 [Oscillochloris sp.]|nr:hypothetical protein [Oscillochloris sp.]